MTVSAKSDSPLVILPQNLPHDGIGPAIRDIEAAADALSEVNPLRLAGDADRIMSAAMGLVRLASAVRLAHRKHGRAA